MKIAGIKVEVGDMIEATFPNGNIESGTVVKIDGRLALDEGNGNIHFIDGGFPEGTEFDFICDAEDEYITCAELEGTEEK